MSRQKWISVHIGTHSRFCLLFQSKPGSSGLLRSVRCSLFDQSCNLLRPGDVDRVAGTRDFDLVAVGSCGIPDFEVRETVCRLLYRTRLAEVTWEALSVVRLVLSSVWHVGRDVHQTGD